MDQNHILNSCIPDPWKWFRYSVNSWCGWSIFFGPYFSGPRYWFWAGHALAKPRAHLCTGKRNVQRVVRISPRNLRKAHLPVNHNCMTIFLGCFRSCGDPRFSRFIIVKQTLLLRDLLIGLYMVPWAVVFSIYYRLFYIFFWPSGLNIILESPINKILL